MLSTPPARTISLAPVCTCIAALMMVCSPEPQRRSSWYPVTEMGRSASRAATRPIPGASPLG